MTADQKFKDSISFQCTAKFMLATNHPLIIKSDDPAFANRVIVIPFRFALPRELQDRTLLQRLQDEKDAIATYAIYAYSRLVANNYIFAGNYNINEVISSSIPTHDIASQIYNFTLANFEKSTESCVLVAEAKERFESQYIAVSSQVFTPLFAQVTQSLFGAEEAKIHNGHKNARKHIKGIKWKKNHIEE